MEEEARQVAWCSAEKRLRWTGLAPWEFEFPFPGSRVFAVEISVLGSACKLLFFFIITLQPRVQ